MTILVRNSIDRLCSECNRKIEEGEKYLAKCKERSDRTAHCVYCLRNECLAIIEQYGGEHVRNLRL